MNWGALALVGVGAAAVVIGFKGSAGNVCTAITGKKCPAFLDFGPGVINGPADPGNNAASLGSICIAKNPDGTCTSFGTNTKTGPLALDKTVASCFANANCKPYITQAITDAANNGIDQVDFLRQIGQESGFNPKAVSSAGAQGIAQFMPATSRTMGIDPFNWQQEMNSAAILMNAYIQRYGGDPVVDEPFALAAYNAGSGATDTAIAKAKSAGTPELWATYLPAQTRDYIDSILSHEG